MPKTLQDAWMKYTETIFYEVAYDICPFADCHARDEFCAVCMRITRAVESAYFDGQRDGMDLVMEKGNEQ